MAARRFDVFRLDRAVPTPSGGLRIDATPTRVGVLTYRDAAGNTVRELRPPEEVAAAESLASLAGAPVTHLHPSEGQVNPGNYKTLQVGHVGDAVQMADDKIHVVAPVYVNDAAMVDAVQRGDLRELSCGYMADLDETPGTFQGQSYDVVQRNIRYNHVALLPPGTGRAGSSVRLRLDSLDRVLVDSPGDSMAKLHIDGKEYVADSAEAQAAIAALGKSRDEALGAVEAAKKTAADLQKRLDAATDPKALHMAVVARQRVLDGVNRLRTAKGQKKLDADAVGTSSDELILAALKLWDPNFDPAGKSPDFIAGYFWAALSGMAKEEPDMMASPADGVTSEMPHDAGGPLPPPEPNRQDAALHKIKGAKSATVHADAWQEDENPRWRQPLAASKDATK